MRKSTLSLCLLSSAAFLSAPALAQDAPPVETAQNDATDPDEVLVTATRRTEALSDVPIAISAVTGATLQNTGATDVRALNQVAPSLLVSGATSEVNFSARIRGIGTVGENPGLESSVGLFIDGVYRSRTGVGLSELGDIERIEVLRGPQGTLFGRNSTAGLINIVTKGPELGEFSGKGSISYGNYDFWRVDGALNAPLGESAALRVDGVWQQRDGFIKTRTPGEPDINDRDRWLVRGQVAFEPSSDLKIRLIGDYSKRDENCCGGVLLGPVRNLTRQAGGSVRQSANSLLPIVQALGANYPTIPDDQRFVFELPNTPGAPYTSDSEDWGVSGELNYNFGAANLTSITAYRDYKNKQGQDGDFSALDILNRQNLDRRFRLFSQELRLQGELFDGRLDWLIGGYYSKEKLDVSDDIKLGADAERFANCLFSESFGRALGAPSLVNTSDSSCFNRPVAAAVAANPLVPAATRGVISGLAGLTPFSAAGFDPRGGYRNVFAGLGQPGVAINGTGNNGSTFRQDSENYAIFTHNTLDIIRDRLSLTVGARYTHESKDLRGDANFTNNSCSVLLASPLQSLSGVPCAINSTAPDILAGSDGTRFRDGEWTGTAVLSFKPIDTVLIYASASKGYKAGGFNLDYSALDKPCSTSFDSACAARLALPVNTQGNGRAEASDLQFKSEKVDAYEVGLKWNGPGIDINLAGFYQEYSNYQLNTFNGVNFEVTNIQACKDDLNGADQDASAVTGACAADRLRPGVISKGFEIEAFMRPVRHLAVNMGLTYTDTLYRRNLVGTGGRPLSPVLFQLPGNNVSNSSEYAVTAGVSWTPPIGSNGMTGLVYLDTRLQSDTNTGSDLDLEKVQDGFVVVNGRIGLYTDKRRFGIELWGQNLLNQRYFQIGADMPLQGSGTYGSVAAPAARGFGATANQLFVGFPGEPRTYGITLRGSF